MFSKKCLGSGRSSSTRGKSNNGRKKSKSTKSTKSPTSSLNSPPDPILIPEPPCENGLKCDECGCCFLVVKNLHVCNEKKYKKIF